MENKMIVEAIKGYFKAVGKNAELSYIENHPFDWNYVELAAGYTSDGAHEIRAYADLVSLDIDYYLDEELVDAENFNSHEEMASAITFSDLDHYFHIANAYYESMEV